MSLMELFSRGNSGNSPIIAAVTATAPDTYSGNSSNSGNSRIAVTETKNKNISVTLSVTDHQRILDWLALIGETDQETIAEMLDMCRNDPETLRYFLRRADEAVSYWQPVPITITCRLCQHFRCFNKHGGGAGHCSVGVWSVGHCRWADTMHQCENYKLNRIKA